MGNFVAGIASNFVERDFTTTPLTDEEIDVLIEQIPKDDVLDSLNQEDKETIMNNYPVNDLVQRLGQSEREKIVKAMSNEKIFNLKGDNIFDYYLTNSKSELKNCMKGHMNKDGTLCTDEKFKRMITTIPNLVMGPLGEKQSQWDTEKQGLEVQWDTEKKGLESQWDTEKKGLEAQWDTEKKGLEAQWDTEKQGLEKRYNTLDAAYDSLQEQKNTLETQWKGEKKGLENKWDTEKKDLKRNYARLDSSYDKLEKKHDTLLKQNSKEAPKTMVTSEGKQDYSMSELDCANYAIATGSTFYNLKDKQNDGNVRTQNIKGEVYYLEQKGEVGKHHLSGAKCKSYAEKNNHEYEGMVEIGVSSPGACILKDNKVSYNMTVGGWENYADCSPTEKCIKKKTLKDEVGGCQVQNWDWNRSGEIDKRVYYYDRNLSTDLCDFKSHDRSGKVRIWKDSNFCVKKWKDYKPDETDTTNFKKDDYKEYSPYLKFMEKVESLGETKDDGSNIWDKQDHGRGKKFKKELVELSDDIRNNIKHISENECRLYAGEDASNYFVRNNKFLPKGCVRQKTMRYFAKRVPGPDPNFGKIFYNYTDKQIFSRKYNRVHDRERTIKYYDKKSGEFKEHKIEKYKPRFTTIVKK